MSRGSMGRDTCKPGSVPQPWPLPVRLQDNTPKDTVRTEKIFPDLRGHSVLHCRPVGLRHEQTGTIAEETREPSISFSLQKHLPKRIFRQSELRLLYKMRALECFLLGCVDTDASGIGGEGSGEEGLEMAKCTEVAPCGGLALRTEACVGLCVHVHTRSCACRRVCVRICVRAHPRPYRYVHMCVPTCLRAHVSMQPIHICVCGCGSAHVCVCGLCFLLFSGSASDSSSHN